MSDAPRKFSSAFNAVVRRHRLARELSQETLSELADVDRTYVGLLERDHRGPGLDVAKRLADALKLPLAKLVAEAEEEWSSRPKRRQPAAIVTEGKSDRYSIKPKQRRVART